MSRKLIIAAPAMLLAVMMSPSTIHARLTIECDDPYKSAEMRRMADLTKLVLESLDWRPNPDYDEDSADDLWTSLESSPYISPYIHEDNPIYKKWFGDPSVERGTTEQMVSGVWRVSGVLWESLRVLDPSTIPHDVKFVCEDSCEITEFGKGNAYLERLCPAYFTLRLFGYYLNSKIGVFAHELTHRQGWDSEGVSKTEDVKDGDKICKEGGKSVWKRGDDCDAANTLATINVCTVYKFNKPVDYCYATGDVLDLALLYPEAAIESAENYERFVQHVYVTATGGKYCPDELNFGSDYDYDGVGDECDNCPCTYNPGLLEEDEWQEDTDWDGRGNECDTNPYNFNALQTHTPCNDVQSEAQEIRNGFVYHGTTVNATRDDSWASCGGISGGGPGVWYKFKGTGATVKASTCTNSYHDLDFNSMSRVYSRYCWGPWCWWFCVTGNDNDYTDDCGSESGASWFASSGRWYYILVNGHGSNEVGTFALSVMEQPHNDICANAQEVSDSDIVDRKAIEGWTVLATEEDYSSAPPCGPSDSVVPRAPGVWYKVIGKNKWVRASTCSGPFGGPYDFDTQISVYRGSCASPVKISSPISCNDDYCDVQSQVSWFASVNVPYYVFVHGYSDEGRFRLTFKYYPYD